MDILEKLMQNNILEISGIISNCIRWILWKLVILLSMLVNSIEKAITKIYSINGFFNSPEVNNLINKYKPLVWLILAVSIGILGFKIMFNRKQNRGELPSNILFSILVLVLLPTLMIKLDSMTSIAVKDVASEYTSSANELIKNNTYDLYYLDSNRFNLNNKNNINSKDIINIDVNETIDSGELGSSSILKKKIMFDKNGNKRLENLDKGWFKIDEEYYRYGIDFLSIIVTLGAMGITLICIGLKVARLIFELAFNKLLATLFAFADIGDGKKLKEIIKHIFSMFIVIFSTAIMTKLYVIFSSWLGTSLGNAGLSANGVAKMIVLIGGSIAVIDGPNIIERILGIDAGLKNGWSAVMAGYGVTKGAMKGLSSLADGIKSVGKASALGASMGAGAVSGLLGKDKNNNINNDNEKEDKDNKNPNKNNISSSIEEDMRNSDSSKNDKSNINDNKENGSDENNINDGNIAENKDMDNLKSINKNNDSNTIEEEMNKAKNSSLSKGKINNNHTPNDINSKNIKDINKNRDNNRNGNTIEEEMNNGKDIKPNRDNINSLNPKGSLNNEISSNKDMKPNRDNIDSINPKGSLNNEISSNKDIKPNRDNIDSINPKGSSNNVISSNKDIKANRDNIDSINPKGGLNNEISSNKDMKPNRDNVDNIKPKEANIVGKMENRTIGEYAKDKFKSSKFIDDLNKSYNLGKNTTSKWNVKRNKNNKNQIR